MEDAVPAKLCCSCDTVLPLGLGCVFIALSPPPKNVFLCGHSNGIIQVFSQ